VFHRCGFFTAAKCRMRTPRFTVQGPQSGAKLNFATGRLWRGAVLFASKSNGSFCSRSASELLRTRRRRVRLDQRHLLSIDFRHLT
jgi:hypothetical protein